MAERTTHERLEDATDLPIRDDATRFRPAPVEHDPTLAGRAQTLADVEQTVSDGDQTAADHDQTVSDRDQRASDSDQAASERDQAASDQDFVRGGDADAHRYSRELRDRSSAERRHSTKVRIEAAAERDAVAYGRDMAALARDRAAAQRDRELAMYDAIGPDAVRAAEDRATAAAGRAIAADGRARAAAAREQAARDREQAARDRQQARVDREALLHELTIAETDGLTGTRTREAGLGDLESEIQRARRTYSALVVAYVDVVGLKRVNDAHGHAAGDALLVRIVGEIRHHLRPYDLIVRVGGDEFVCAMSGSTEASARRRLAAVQAALSADSDPGEIRVGFASLRPSDSVSELVARADAELLSSRQP